MDIKYVPLDPKSADKPIDLPDKPFIAKIKDFGSDEVLAAGVDPISTTVMDAVLSRSLKQYVLPFVGPITEKIMFFPRHIWSTRKIYVETPKDRRRKFSYYLKDGLKHGYSNLMKDIMYHDPIYVLIMWFGLLYTTIAPGILSVASYVIGILAAAGIDVGKDEIKHKMYKKDLKNNGFIEEQYYESRFYIFTRKNPDEVIAKMSKKFGLHERSTIRYNDEYYFHKLPQYSGRIARFRLRSRDRRGFEKDNTLWGENDKKVNTLQVTFTTAQEHKKDIDQCRYFPSKKEKLYMLLPHDVKNLRASINSFDESTRKIIRQMLGSEATPYSRISFERTVVSNNELALCVDKVRAKELVYIVELKVYKDTNLLKQAMRYLMVECPIAALQTTRGKSDLLIS
jgi:hypothetical protein